MVRRTTIAKFIALEILIPLKELQKVETPSFLQFDDLIRLINP